MNTPRTRTQRRLNALTIARLTVAIIDDALTVHELKDECGLALFTTRHYVLTLHREGGCHIEHWERDSRGRYTTPAYRLGRGKDAKRPKISRAESNRAYRQRVAQLDMLRALAA